MKTELRRYETGAVPALCMQELLPVWEQPVRCGAFAETGDYLLHGQLLRVTEVGPDESFDESCPYTVTRFGRFFHYVTDYGYEGYMIDGGERIQTECYLPQFQTAQDLGAADAERMENVWGQYTDIAKVYFDAYREAEENGWGNIYNLHARLATVWAPCADLFSVPDITDTVHERYTVFRGAKLYAPEDQSGVKEGWTKVFPLRTMFFGEEDPFFDGEAEAPDDGAFYIRSSALCAPFELVEIDYDAETKLENCSVYGRVTPRDEAAFRRNVTETAKLYLWTPYRWAGKTVTGIDCSGLCSMAYMLNGVYIYRDAKMAEGYPVHELVSGEEWRAGKEAALSKMKAGDLLYYKGHIAMYLGDGKYIHSTGRAGSDGVVINSLRPEDPDYRRDLDEELLAVGTVF